MRGLRARLILSHVLPMLIILPVVGFILVYLLESQVLVANLSQDLSRQALVTAEFASESPEIWIDPGRAAVFVRGVSSMLSANVRLLDSQRRLLVSSDPADASKLGQVLDLPSTPASSGGERGVTVTYRQVGGKALADVVVPVFLPDGSVLGYVWLVNPLADVYQRILQLRQLIIIVLGVALVAGVVTGLIFALDLERPLKRTTHAVLQLAGNERSTPLQEEGPTEVRLLARAFNTLLDRLETLEASRKQLLANLIHELGRPLGALSSASQALLGGADEDPTLRKELLQGMDDELHRLQRLLDDLADLYQQAIGPLDLSMQRVTLEDWLPRVLAPWRQAALQKRLHWEQEFPPQMPVVEMDPDRIAQVLGNLISNAIRYTPAGGKVSVSVKAEDGTINFVVRDTGPGISAEDQAHLFSPFFRGSAQSRFPQGMGLGLSIARDLVLAHKGEISVDSAPGRGSTFMVRLPVLHIQERLPDDRSKLLPSP